MSSQERVAIRGSEHYRCLEFDRDHYHLLTEMTEWCELNIGLATGRYGNPESLDASPDRLWAWECNFGHSRFTFRNESDYIWFKLKWA